jgi:hypothetical protein
MAEFCNECESAAGFPFRFQAQTEPGSSLGKDYVLREITNEKFEEYFVKWKRVQMDVEARQCVSPYAM